MKLVIRTSSGPYAVGLFDQEDGLLVQKHTEGGGVRQSTLGELLQECLLEIDKAMGDLTEIIVDLGPGGLSSTRVGVSFANALSYGMRLNLLGVSALRMQIHDVGPNCRTPTLSMRPAPGGQSIWALFDGSDLTASGCGNPDEVIAEYQKLFGTITVVGPLQRLKLDSKDNRTCILNIDSPSLESMLKSPKIPPQRDGRAFYLEPINSTDGASR